MPKLQHPRMLALRARLWAVRRGCPVPALPPGGARSFDLAGYGEPAVAEDFCHAIGYRRLVRRDRSALAVRADVLERLAREAYKLAAAAPSAAEASAAPGTEGTDGFVATTELRQLADCSDADLEAMLFTLGYRRHGSRDGQPLFLRKGARRHAPAQAARPEGAGETPAVTQKKSRPRGKRKADPAAAARKEEARRREEKRLADSPFAILRQLTAGGE